MDFDVLIDFLRFCERRVPRHRFCEFTPVQEQEYLPVFQEIGFDNRELDRDKPGEAGLRSLVNSYNNKLKREKENPKTEGVR